MLLLYILLLLCIMLMYILYHCNTCPISEHLTLKTECDEAKRECLLACRYGIYTQPYEHLDHYNLNKRCFRECIKNSPIC